jgi:hypothetical protein
MVLEGGLWYAELVSENNVVRFTIVKKKICRHRHRHTQNIKKKRERDLRFPWKSVLRLVFWDVMPFCLVD